MIRELIPPETRLAFPAMHALRPHLEDQAVFVRRVDETQRAEGYRLIGAFGGEQEHAVAAAGFRVAHSLSWGRFLYVDDLSTLERERRRGHAGRLLDWLFAEGERLGCGALHLDSGVESGRSDAHRLYLNAGMPITAHHFARPLTAK